MLNFVEEMVLLQFDDTRGKVVELPSSAGDIVLAGAALMELALRNRIDTDIERLTLLDRTPTGDAILDDALGRLAAADGELSVGGAIGHLTGNAAKYHDWGLEQLIAKGVLRESGGRFLWVFPTRRYPVVDDREQREVKARLRQLVLTDEIPEPRDVALICLIDACGLLNLLLNGDEIKRTAARVAQLARLDLIGQAVTDAVAEIRFIVKHTASPLH